VIYVGPAVRQVLERASVRTATRSARRHAFIAWVVYPTGGPRGSGRLTDFWRRISCETGDGSR
jgi:hypothetical protein